MKLISQIALGTALVMGAAATTTFAEAPAAAQEAEAYQPEISRSVREPLAAAQAAMQEQNYEEALAQLQAAEAAAETADDRYVANQIKLNLAIQQSNDALIDEALVGMLDSGSAAITPSQEAQFLSRLGNNAIQEEDYPAAIGYFERLLQAQPTNAAAQYNMGVLYSRMDQQQQSYDAYSRAIDIAEQQGQPAERDWYMVRFNKAATEGYDLMEPGLAFIRAYPDGETWRHVLLTYRDVANPSDDRNLDIFRLLSDADALEQEGDFYEYADTAHRRFYFAEAQNAINAGLEAGALDQSRPYVSELKTAVDSKVGEERAELDSLAADAEAAPTGEDAASTATAYLGSGNNAEAARLYRVALEKGGVDAAEINTRLGIALTRMGDYDAARQAFQAADSGDQGTLADFWLAYVDSLQG